MRDFEERDLSNEVPYPGKVTAAGVIWIVFGGLMILGTVIIVIAAGMLAGAAGGRGAVAGQAMAGGICAAVLPGLIGGAFLFVGIQSVNGSAKDTLGNGIGSIIFACLVLVGGIYQVGSGVSQAKLSGMFNIIFAGALITGGVLALVGRDDYRAWKRQQRDRERRQREF